MRVLVIGGTGPTGIPIVERLVEPGTTSRSCTGARTSERRRRPTSSTSTPTPTTRRALRDALAGTTFDVDRRHVRAAGRIAELTRGVTGRFVSVGGVPAYRGWMNPWLLRAAGAAGAGRRGRARRRRARARREGLPHRPHRGGGVRAPSRRRALPLPVRVRPVPARRRASGAIVRRVLDGRARIVVADDGLTLHHHGYTENLAARGRCSRSNSPTQRGQDLQRRRRGGADGAPGRRAHRRRARPRARDRVDALRPRACRRGRCSRSRSPTHRVLDLTRLQHQLGYRDVVPGREAVGAHRPLARRAPARARRPGGEDPHRPVRLRRPRTRSSTRGRGRDASVARPRVRRRAGLRPRVQRPAGGRACKQEFEPE